MKYFRFVFLAAVVFFSAAARAQSVSPARAHADSVQRFLLQDSLGLSSSVATQFLALRDSSLARSERIQTSTTLTSRQISEQLQTERRTLIEAVRELIGSGLYQRYLQLLSAQ